MKSFIAKERFSNFESIKDFSCMICNNFLINWINCLSCQSRFCLNCYTICVAKEKCIRCMKSISNFEIERKTNLLLPDLKIKCENQECNYISNIENIENHQNKCPFKKRKYNIFL